MSRRWPWRSKPTAAEASMLADVDSGAIKCFMLAELGATSFVVRERQQPNPDVPQDQPPHHQPKYKVRIGDGQTCDCGVAKPGVSLCSHIFFVMKRILRVTDQSCLAFQLSLTENEVDDILNKREQQRINQSNNHSNNQSKGGQTTKDKSVKVREIGEDDVCGVCQEALIEPSDSENEPKALTCCLHGCGGSLHASCMRVWAEHQQQTGQQSITCPLCRSVWISDQSTNDIINQLKYDEEHPTSINQQSTNQSASNKRTKPSRFKPSVLPDPQIRVKRRCKECRSVISSSDPLVRCVTCVDYNACRNCVRKAMKPIRVNDGESDAVGLHCHILVQRQGPRWSVPVIKSTRSHAALVSELQQRELTAADYETLLSLDAGNAPLHTYVAAAFETWKRDHDAKSSDLPPCVWCDSVNSHRLCSLSCGCPAHEHCINSASMFELEKLRCPGCNEAVFPGFVEWSAQAARAAKAPKPAAKAAPSKDVVVKEESKRPFNESLGGTSIVGLSLKQAGSRQQTHGRRSKLLMLTESTAALSLSQSFEEFPLSVGSLALPSINSRSPLSEESKDQGFGRFNQPVALARRSLPRAHSNLDRFNRSSVDKSSTSSSQRSEPTNKSSSLQLPSLFGAAMQVNNPHPKSAPVGDARRKGVLRPLGALRASRAKEAQQLDQRLD